MHSVLGATFGRRLTASPTEAARIVAAFSNWGDAENAHTDGFAVKRDGSHTGGQCGAVQLGTRSVRPWQSTRSLL